MKSFKQFLKENITPKHYWLAIDIPKEESEYRSHKKVVDQLKSGELHGVQGIAKDKRIVRNFFHSTRNAVLVMPHDEVHKLNPNIRPIEYQNPHSMMKNGMHDLHRILQKEKNDRGTDQVMGHIFEHGVREASAQNPNHVEYHMSSGAFNRGQDMHVAMKRANGGKFPEIHSPEDFEHHVNKALDHDEQVEKDYRDGKSNEKPMFGGSFKQGMREDIRKTFKNVGGAAKFAEHASNGIGRMYQDEGEHAVDAPSFKIPKGSKLIALTDHERVSKIKNSPMAKHLGLSDSEKNEISKHETYHNSLKELGNYYNVKEIENSHYEKNRVYGKRPKFKKEIS